MTKERSVRLPYIEFFYTLDQVATLLQVKEPTLKEKMLYYAGREGGIRPKDKILAVNIKPDGQEPEWRIPQRSFKVWLQYKGYRDFDRLIVS